MESSTISRSKLCKLVESNLPEVLTLIVSAKSLEKTAWAKVLPDALQARVLSVLEREADKPKAGAIIKIAGRSKNESDLVLGVLPKDLSAFSQLGFSRTLLKSSLKKTTKTFGVVTVEDKGADLTIHALGSAIAAAVFTMPSFGKKLKEQKSHQLKSVTLFTSSDLKKVFNEGFEMGEGTNLVRYLATLPANECTPEKYGKRIKELCSKHGIELKIHTNHQLKKMGAGAFTAVDQGNPDSAGGIFELSYSPRGAKNKNPYVMVGKGLCFDTGGYDIKTQGYMLGMKGDMAGSALALSVLVTAAKLKWPLKMKAFLGITENHISPKAYKADDVVIALNGMSIEIINTDAEGRMVLADTLTLASKSSPELIMDFATLTGCATIAIGTSYSAVFTNKEEWHSKIIESGKNSGERVWTFPIDEDFGKAIESDVADIKQCAKGRGPDHIQAAYFLSKFVGENIPWVHVDLSAMDKEGGLAHVDSYFTGFGVRFTLDFLKKVSKVK